MRFRILILVLFFLSGATGLIYEIAWTRKLTLVFGTSSLAVSTVLAVFMGGLALGSWILGRLGDRDISLLRLYGFLEIGIALLGLSSLLLLDAVQYVFLGIRHSSIWTPWIDPWLRFSLAVVALIAPTTLMGATLPILVKSVSQTPGRIARSVGLMYAVNTLGAAAGTAVTAVYLMEEFGLRATVFVAAGLNLMIGLAAIAISTRERKLVKPPERVELPPVADRSLRRIVLFAFGASGFFGLAYEVLWTRYLIYVVGENSVYAFSMMLVSFLLGIALGSSIAGWLADRVANPVALLGAILVLIGASALGTVASIGFLANQDWSISGYSYWAATGLRFLRCVAILIVPTTLSGSTFAVVAKIYARDAGRVGRDVGRVYAANTFGAILGAVAGGFLILPYLGLVSGLIVVAGANVLVGMAVLLCKTRYGGRAVKPALVTGLAAVAALISVAFASHPTDKLVEPGFEIVFYADGSESSVAVLRSRRTGHVNLTIDGDHQSGTEPKRQVHLRLLAHLPALFHPEPTHALVVGFGSGVTVGSMAQHPLEQVDVVELSSAVIEAAPLFSAWNHDPLNNPKVRLFHGDGRNFLLATDKIYDVITSDPIDSSDAGVTSLYSLEYYQLVRSRLSSNGVACQWVDTYHRPDDYRMLLRTFQRVFPDTSVWNGRGYTIFLGFKSGPAVSLAGLRRKLENPQVRQSLAYVGIRHAEELLSLLVAGPTKVRQYVGDGPLNTDDRPLIEYRGPRWSGDQGMREDNIDIWNQLVDLRSSDRSDIFIQ